MGLGLTVDLEDQFPFVIKHDNKKVHALECIEKPRAPGTRRRVAMPGEIRFNPSSHAKATLRRERVLIPHA